MNPGPATLTARDAALLRPIRIGDTHAENRMFMAPLTRSRAQADGTQWQLAAQYFAQRASSGLIVSEATTVSAAANGAYLRTPGNYTDRHQQKWAEIATAVHAAGGRMFMQLWHVGRMAHPEISGVESVAPSAIAADELAPIVEQFRAAARRAIDAGMDGVEIHAANGYLLHEFASDVINRRTDAYGGSPDNRARLTAEVVEAVVAEVGAGRVGLRISPGNTVGDMREVDEVSAYQALLTRIAPLDIAYLHLLINPDVPAFGAIRPFWFGPLVLNTGRDIETTFCQLEELAEWGVISAASVGRAFLANPDLIDRLVVGAELNEPDVASFYSPGPVGYIDYPALEELGLKSA
jgi:N-ethylmaleimide reductase